MISCISCNSKLLSNKLLTFQSEDEALRRAILSSQAEGNVKQTPEDEELQKAIMASLNEQSQNNTRSKLSSDCSVS